MKKTALLMTRTGYSDEELVFAYHYLLSEDFDPLIMSDVVGYKPKPLRGIHGVLMHSDARYDELSTKPAYYHNNCNLLILIGGVKSLEYLRQDSTLIKFISEWNEQNKLIGSICHGSQLLIEADICKGRTINGYYSIKTDIINSGGKYPVNEQVTVDGNIVSCPHYNFQGKWMKLLVEEFNKKYGT